MKMLPLLTYVSSFLVCLVPVTPVESRVIVIEEKQDESLKVTEPDDGCEEENNVCEQYHFHEWSQDDYQGNMINPDDYESGDY